MSHFNKVLIFLCCLVFGLFFLNCSSSNTGTQGEDNLQESGPFYSSEDLPVHATPLPDDFFKAETELLVTLYPGERPALLTREGFKILPSPNKDYGFSYWKSGDEIISTQERIYFGEESESLDALGSDLLSLNVLSGVDSLIYQTIGLPGFYESFESSNNRPALDLTIEDIHWSTSRSMGAIEICGVNRLLEVNWVNCEIQFLSDTGSTLFGTVDAGAPSWSPSGELAYSNSSGEVRISSVSDNGLLSNTRIVFTSSTFVSTLSWSPDGRFLALIEKHPLDNSFGAFGDSYLKIVDLSDNTDRAVLRINFGTVGNTSLSWSPAGTYLVFGIKGASNAEQEQIWWVNVVSGETGPLTNTIQAKKPYFKRAF